MCGEHPGLSRLFRRSSGSSPHVRGAQDAQGKRTQTPGIIPACAGSTEHPVSAIPHSRDHPRMCGEHQTMRGPSGQMMGSSPHVRGAPFPIAHDAREGGIIPACAGSTAGSEPSRQLARDHPRMCGEHRLDGIQPSSSRGSSPHVRGARLRD